MDIKYVCSSCFKIYAHATSLRRHVNTYRKNRRHTCEKIQIGFKRVESLRTHKRLIHGKTGDYPKPTNRQTTVTAPLNTAILEKVFQTPTFELTCTGNLRIYDRLGTNTVQLIEEKNTYTTQFRRTWTFSRTLLKVIKFSWTSVPKKSKFGSIKTVYHRLKQSCTTTGKLPSCLRKRTNCTTTKNALFSLVTNYTNMSITTKENNTFSNLRGSEFISSIPNKTLYSETSYNAVPCLSRRHLATTGIHIDVGTV